MEQSLGFAHFMNNTGTVVWVIFGILLIQSIGTWYLIVTKSVRLFWLRRRGAAFLKAFWEAPHLEAVASQVRETGAIEPYSHLLHHGFTAIEQWNRCRNGGDRGPGSLVDAGSLDDLLTRALKRSIDEDKTRLEFGQTFLATVASSAPFLGLFGTVWGIYSALIAIAVVSHGTTLDKVAGPMGEALTTTIAGLAVAIPAAVAYNIFARINRNLLSGLQSFAYDVLAFLSTGIKTSPMLTDARVTSEKVIELVRAGSGKAVDPVRTRSSVR